MLEDSVVTGKVHPAKSCWRKDIASAISVSNRALISYT